MLSLLRQGSLLSMFGLSDKMSLLRSVFCLAPPRQGYEALGYFWWWSCLESPNGYPGSSRVRDATVGVAAVGALSGVSAQIGISWE